MGVKRDTAVLPDGTRIRLVPGNHSSPREGVCVVELASLFAGEEFSDRPRCVCPVIAAFLRGWNDRAPYAERQRLAPYAARIVGSRGGDRVTRERRNLCLEWAGADLRHGLVRRLLAQIGIRTRIAVFCGLGKTLRPNEGAGDYVARLVYARDDVEGAFKLLDALLAVGEEGRSERPLVTTAGNGHALSNGNGHGPFNGNGHALSNGNGRARSNGNGQAAVGSAGLPAASGNGSNGNGGLSPAKGLEDESPNGAPELPPSESWLPPELAPPTDQR
jgi:hypothetical protein